jgi:hypothetical protein
MHRGVVQSCIALIGEYYVAFPNLFDGGGVFGKYASLIKRSPIAIPVLCDMRFTLAQLRQLLDSGIVVDADLF